MSDVADEDDGSAQWLTLRLMEVLVHAATPRSPPIHRLRRHLGALLGGCGIELASADHQALPKEVCYTITMWLPPDRALYTVRCLVKRDPKRSLEEDDWFGERVATEIAWRVIIHLVTRAELLRAGKDADGRWRVVSPPESAEG